MKRRHEISITLFDVVNGYMTEGGWYNFQSHLPHRQYSPYYADHSVPAYEIVLYIRRFTYNSFNANTYLCRGMLSNVCCI